MTKLKKAVGAQNLLMPLSDAELNELDHFLLYELDNDEAMTLDTLDGFLHAIAIGPETVMPARWLPKVWGEADDLLLPPLEDLNRLNHIVNLLMRHYNSILSGFAAQPPFVAPCWGTREFDGEQLEDAEAWAYGFNEGVKLSQDAWQALLKDPEAQRWYRPIGLLGADEFCAEQDVLTRTPHQRQDLAGEIENSLVHIHSFWLPLRHAVAERQQAQHLSSKVGRNEPCPCGSGKKFKKCCGAASNLH